MFKTHLKFAVRVFLKDKFFSVLNILGLALGIAVSIILLLILQHDLTYDKYHVNHQRIYRLGGHLWATGIDVKQARTARELGAILKEELPEVLEVVRANNWDHTLVTYEKDNSNKVAFYEEDIVRTDSTFFDVFTHEFIAGDPKSCLKELNTLVITESIAKKYFGNDDAIGQTLRINDASWKVTAVIKDVPENTHLKFNILMSRLIDREWVMDEGKLKSEAFWNPDVYTYLLFPANYNPADFHAKFPNIFNKYFKSFGDQVGGHYEPILEPLADIHFHSQLESDEAHGNIAYLYAFTAIGIMIIILACINYMNLSTAKSVTRATEIAMKKTLGSGRRALVLSVLFESVFLSMASLLIGVVLVFLILKATSFNQLIGKNLSPDFLDNPLLLFGSIAIALAIGVIAGLYPAFYLPSIPTLKALKGSFKNRRSSHTLRRILITTQFAISIFVVVCTMFMQDQIDYVRNKELGFEKDNVVLLPIQDTTVQKQIHPIKNEFLQNPRITEATTAYNVMGMNVGGGPVMWAEAETGMKQQQFTMMLVGDKYFETMGMDLLQGRNFKEGVNADVDDVFIVNEAAAKLMGWKDAVGKKMKFFHAEHDGQVIGLVKDFNFNSLHNAVGPLIIIKAREEGGFLHLKVKGENLPETIALIKDKWSKLDPYHPFEYFFLDERFNEQYKEDEVQYKLLSGLSYVCIFISLLGLLGLSAFSATQRTKEIGIRKVHGASIPSIIYLLYKDVMILVIISAVCVVPISYYMISQWLSNFAYQTEINYFVFATVAGLALVFAFCTVAFHSMKTARTNPVNALKYE
jgi:putative ABC transport system permease protein